MEPHAHLGRDDARQRRLPDPRWPANRRWSTAWPPPGRLEDHEVLLELALTDELLQPAGTEAGVLGDLSRASAGRVEELVTHG